VEASVAKFKLMSHQVDGVKFLDSVDGIGALLWDPGVGKTGCTMSYIDLLAKRYGEVRVLVVAPLTAADTWVLQTPDFMDSTVKARMLQGTTTTLLTKVGQARHWTQVPDMKISVNHVGTKARQVSGNRVTILSMSAGAISSYCDNRTKTVGLLRAVRKFEPHLIVVDESHIIKSATANISKALYQIGQLADHRIILTGTVNPLSPLDVYGQWRFLAPWTFSEQYKEAFTKDPLNMTRTQKASIKPWSWSQFKQRYTVAGGYKGKGVKGYRGLKQLRDRTAERSMVVLREDALDLPATRDVDIHIQLSPREQKAYTEMAEELATELKNGELVEAPNALAKIMKLRQIHAGYIHDTETKITHSIGRSLQKGVCEVVNVQLAGENRVVVFGYFKRECEMLAAELAKTKGRKVEVITGDTKPDERLAIRQRFGDVSGNPEPIVLVAQVRTMSLSVNELVTAQHAVYASVSERRVDVVQSRDRLNRPGQTKPVTYWNVRVPGLISEIMMNNHQTNGSMEKALLDHIRSYIR
jgi:SNF2 family DNA or RNA helicase